MFCSQSGSDNLRFGKEAEAASIQCASNFISVWRDYVTQRCLPRQGHEWECSVFFFQCGSLAAIKHLFPLRMQMKTLPFLVCRSRACCSCFQSSSVYLFCIHPPTPPHPPLGGLFLTAELGGWADVIFPQFFLIAPSFALPPIIQCNNDFALHTQIQGSHLPPHQVPTRPSCQPIALCAEILELPLIGLRGLDRALWFLSILHQSARPRRT